jgi:hypothetical protein
MEKKFHVSSCWGRREREKKLGRKVDSGMLGITSGHTYRY